MIQTSPTSQPVRCDSDPKIHLVVSLLTKVHPVMQVLCTKMMRCRKGTQEGAIGTGIRGDAQQCPPPLPPPNSYDC